MTKPYVKKPKPPPPVDMAKVEAKVREIELAKAEAIRRGVAKYGLKAEDEELRGRVGKQFVRCAGFDQLQAHTQIKGP